MIPRYKVLPVNGYRKTALCIRAVAYISACLTATAHAENIPAANDATLHETQNASISDGAGQHFYVGRLGSNGGERRRRGLVRFDLSAIVPPGSRVDTAVVRLNMSRTASSSVATVSLHRVTQAWSEGPSAATTGQGAPSQSGDTSWRHAHYPGTLWGTAGGDAVDTAVASQSIGGVGTYAWTSPALVADVQHWLDRPQENFGWLLVGDESGSRTIKRFDAHENSSSQGRPVLEVTFTPPLEVPETFMSAEMHAGHVVPAPSGDAMGLARIGYDFMSRAFTVRVHHDLLDGTELTLHGPAQAGQTAPVMASLGNVGVITSGSNTLSLLEAQDLLDGLCYLQIASVSLPGGAIRGQILADQDFAVQMSASPSGGSFPSLAMGVGFIRLETNVLTLTAMHNTPAASTLRLLAMPDHRGARAVMAEWPAQDGQGRGRLDAQVVLSLPEMAALQAGALDLALLSADTNVMAGGAWQAIDPDPDPVFSGRLDGGQAIPQAANNLLGALICGYDPATRSLDYRLTHSVSDIAAGFLIGGAGVGTNGTVVADLQQLSTSLRGRLVLGTNTQSDLERGLTYFSIHNSVFPGGAVRGQVYRGQGFSATLSGRHVWPHVTTHERGTAVFTLHEDTRELEFYVIHDVNFAQSVFLRFSVEVPGPDLVLSTQGAPETWGRVVLSYPQWRSIVDGTTRIGVSTVAYPDGKIVAPVRTVGRRHVTTHTASLVRGGTGVDILPSAYDGLMSLDYDCRTGELSCQGVHDLTNMASVLLLRHAPAHGVTNAVIARFGEGGVVNAQALIEPATGAGLGGGEYRIAVVDGDTTNALGRVHSVSRFASVLNARQNEPVEYHDSAGLALCDFDASNKVLHVYFQHSSVVALAGAVRRVHADGRDDVLIQGFSSITAKAFFSIVLDEEEADALQRGAVYIEAYSLLDGSQNVRGGVHRTRPDDDCNDIPNAWESAMGLAPGQYDRDQDFDGDGWDVFDEYVLGSDPAVSNVPWRVSLSSRSNTTLHVSADGHEDRQYLLETRPDLNAGYWQADPGTWGQYPISNRVVFTHSNTAARTFFRIKGLVPQP